MEKRTDIDLNEYLKNQKKQQKYMESVFQVIKDGMEKLKNEKDRVQFEYVGGINPQSQQIEVFNKKNITNLRLYDKEGKLYFNDADMTPEKGFDKLLKYIAINNEKEGTEKINFPEELQNYVDFAKNITNKSKSKEDNLMDIEISDILLDKEKFHLNKYDETYISINTYRKNDWKENIDWNIRIKSHDRVINEFDVDNIGTEKISDIFTNIAFGIDYLKENGNKLDNVSITKSSEGIDDETGAFVKEVKFNIAGEDYSFKYESETSNKKRDISIKNSDGELLYHVHTDPKKGDETYELGEKMTEKLWDNMTYGLSDKNIVIPKTFNRVERLPIEFGNKERNEFKKEWKSNFDKFNEENSKKNTAIEELGSFELKKIYINQADTPKKYYREESMSAFKLEDKTYLMKEETSLKQNDKFHKEFSLTIPKENDREVLKIKIDQDKENPKNIEINLVSLDKEEVKKNIKELDKFFKEKHGIDLTQSLKEFEKKEVAKDADLSKLITYDWTELEGEDLKAHKKRVLTLNHYRIDNMENSGQPVVFLNSKECDELRMKHSTDIFEKYGITTEDVKEFRNGMFYDDLIQRTSKTFNKMEETGKENVSKMEANEKVEDIVNETSNSKQYETMDKENKENIISEYQEKMENIFNIFTEEVEGYKMINIEKFNNEFKDTFERMVNEDKEKINEIKNIFKEEKVKAKEKDDFEK